MKNLKNRYSKLLNNFLPILFFVFLIIIFFWKVFFLGQVPIPADLVVGAYFPWLDYKWGYDVGVPVKNLITSDVVSVVYPIRSYAIDQITRGESALWNPHMFGGYPLLANFQIAIFSFTTLLYLILPKVLAWTGQIIVQPFFAMVFSYILLRHLKVSKPSSFMGSAIYAFSGFNMIWLEWSAHSLTSAFIPLIIYLVSKLIEDKKMYWGVFLSIAVTLQIFSGYPQLFVYTMIAVFIYIFVCHYQQISFKLLLKIILFIGLGIAGASIQLLPAFELLSHSQRIAENLSSDLIYLPWQNWITFLAPDFFGNHATGNFWGIGNYTNNVGYTGIIALCLSFVAIINYKINKYIKYFFILLTISLLFSFPFVWSRYIYGLNLPGIGASSLTRILILANLTIAYLSAFGLDMLIEKKSRILVVLSTAFTLILVGLFLFSFNQYRTGNLLYLISIRNLMFPLILMTALLLLSIMQRNYRKYSNIFITLIIIFSLFELFRFGWKYTPFSDKSLVFPDTPIIKFLSQQDPLDRIHFGEVIPMNMWSSYNLSSPSGYDAVYPLTIAKYIAAANSGIASTSPMGRHGSFDNVISPLFDLANNKYILALKRDKLAKPDINGNVSDEYNINKFIKIFEDKSVAVLENKNVFPRVFFVSSWETITNDEKILERLMDPKFDLKGKIILTDSFGEFDKERISPNYEINNIEYKSGSNSLSLKNDKNGFLFVSDTYYPGWQVFVDGLEKKIYRANYTFRAVPITKGEHKILFIYNPKSFRIGKIISASALLVLFLLFLYGYKNIYK